MGHPLANPCHGARPSLTRVFSACLKSLRAPPGNRLEALTSDRQGKHSIRISDQWRLCFVWSDDDVLDVKIVDYH